MSKAFKKDLGTIVGMTQVGKVKIEIPFEILDHYSSYL